MKPWPRRFYVWMERVAAKCSDTILSQNREDIATAVAEGIARPDLVEMARQRHRPGAIRPPAPFRQHTRPRCGTRSTSTRLHRSWVSSAVWSRKKAFWICLQAAKTVVEVIPNAQFLIVGPYDDEKPDALRPDVAERYGVAANCRFVGMRNDMPELYALMDVLVLPSYREGFPRAPMEASAMGVPAIVTDIRGCREAVDHGENGLLFPVGDADALARSLVELLQDDGRRTRMGVTGRRIAEDRFDEQQVFDRVLSEYERLLR